MSWNNLTKHYKTLTGNEVRAIAKKANSDLLEGKITVDEALEIKKKMIAEVVLSHQAVVSNLFLF